MILLNRKNGKINCMLERRQIFVKNNRSKTASYVGILVLLSVLNVTRVAWSFNSNIYLSLVCHNECHYMLYFFWLVC